MLSNNQKNFDTSLDKEMKMSKDKQNVISSSSVFVVNNTEIMSSSTQSLSSSLASPGDSGVQLLDSESDMASIMSMSGQDFTENSFGTRDETYLTHSVDKEDDETSETSHRISVILNKDFQITEKTKPQEITQNELQVDQNLMTTSDIVNQNTTQPIHDWKIYSQSAPTELMKHRSRSPDVNPPKQSSIETKEDEIISENLFPHSTTPPVTETENVETNQEDVMQTSIITPMIDDQIVYRRQRRKKIKSQDTPKKRVSFHEDILNSTKIDDIHINRGFITRQSSDGLYSTDNNMLHNKHGVVLGRYSWAAEGDHSSTCYNHNNYTGRDVKSDLIHDRYLYPNSTPNVISNSSSSSMSLDDSSSASSSDSLSFSPTKEGDLGGILNGIQNIKKVPKSSCLKKPKYGVIDTKIVHENRKRNNNLTRKISESNILLDTNNIFGSLKNIYKTLSTSMPLAQRGVPEGQEDFITHSEYSHGNHNSKRNSYSSSETLFSKSLENNHYMQHQPHEVVVEPPEAIVEQIPDSSSGGPTTTNSSGIMVVEHRPIKIYKKPNLRLSRSEGFYPNYPNDTMTQHQLDNIILCDSNVYEHRGISYSYEYDQFQSTFNNSNNGHGQSSTTTTTTTSTLPAKQQLEAEHATEHSDLKKSNQSKQKSSTVYQMLLDEINFLKKSECNSKTMITSLLGGGGNSGIVGEENKQAIEKQTTTNVTSTPIKKQQIGKNQPSIPSDWSSDTESISDIYTTESKSMATTSASSSSKHLQSPLKKRNLKPNHFSIQSSNKVQQLSDNSIDATAFNSSETLLMSLKTNSSSKTSLINRFLRNVTQRKLFETKFQQQKNDNNCKNNLLSNLYKIEKIQPRHELIQALNMEIEQEIALHFKEKQNDVGSTVDLDENDGKYQKIIQKIMRQQNGGEEFLFRIYKVKSAYNMNGETKPILLLITNTTLYIFSLNNNSTEYYNEFMMPLKEIHFILIGPNRQTIYLTNKRFTLYYFILTANSQLTTNIVGQIEFIIRKSKLSTIQQPSSSSSSGATAATVVGPTLLLLPSIKEFMLNDMIQLRYAIYQQTSVTKDEDFHLYNLIHIEDEQQILKESPLGPFHDGFLMYRKAQTDDRWQFGYFLLKAGVLYMFPSPTTRIPIKMIQLYDGECYGVHRTQPRPRPHTFELFTRTESLEFAASDEYEASEWLQMFVQSASGMQIMNNEIQQQQSTSCCSLILTTDHLVTVRECFNFDPQQTTKQTQTKHNDGSHHHHHGGGGGGGGIQTLSCAAISDLTSFKIPVCCDKQSWCILEFSCREVRETSGDWILYFSTNIELNKFLSTFEVLWSCTNNTQGDKFPLTTINDTDNNIVYRHASETYRILQQAWISFQ